MLYEVVTATFVEIAYILHDADACPPLMFPWCDLSVFPSISHLSFYSLVGLSHVVCRRECRREEEKCVVIIT